MLELYVGFQSHVSEYSPTCQQFGPVDNSGRPGAENQTAEIGRSKRLIKRTGHRQKTGRVPGYPSAIDGARQGRCRRVAEILGQSSRIDLAVEQADARGPQPTHDLISMGVKVRALEPADVPRRVDEGVNNGRNVVAEPAVQRGAGAILKAFIDHNSQAIFGVVIEITGDAAADRGKEWSKALFNRR